MSVPKQFCKFSSKMEIFKTHQRKISPFLRNFVLNMGVKNGQKLNFQLFGRTKFSLRTMQCHSST